jgi:hypothetical protein
MIAPDFRYSGVRSIVRLSRQAAASLAITVLLVAIAIVGYTTAVRLSGPSASLMLSLPTPTTSAAPSAPPTPSSTPRKRPPPNVAPWLLKVATPAATPPKTVTSAAGVEVWNLAPGGTGVVGSGGGTLYKYRVEVEQATTLSAASVAAVVDQTLADPRGWTAGGSRFQRVTLPRNQVNMIVMLATPATVDKLCLRYGGLNTGGTVSCRAGVYVIINLTRWNTGVKSYGSDVAGYRHLVLNHEIGHRLGKGHVSCPGAGQPQPVMMQVYYTGLQGCVKNPWPYTADGTFIG